MSRLPKGTSAVRSYLDRVIVNAVMAKCIAAFPFLALPVVKQILEVIVERVFVDPSLDQAESFAIASVYVVDRIAFDRAFITIKVMEDSGASPEQLEVALENAEKAMARFIRRGPLE